MRVAVVTGGAQGIGLGIAHRLIAEGYQVLIADLDAEAGHEAASDLGPRAHFFACDVRSEEQIKALLTEARRLGGPHLIVSNAGIPGFSPFFNTPSSFFDEVLAVNLRAGFLLARHGAEPMQALGGGSIIFIASTRALQSEPNSEAYAASKGGLLALTHALATTLGPAGIRVNCISPGWIEVGPWQKRAKRTEPRHSARDKAQHPVSRVGTPADIAAAVAFLASEQAGFITGQNLVIDGGMTIKMIYE